MGTIYYSSIAISSLQSTHLVQYPPFCLEHPDYHEREIGKKFDSVRRNFL
jgi:hypothetical protein